MIHMGVIENSFNNVGFTGFFNSPFCFFYKSPFMILVGDFNPF